MHVPQPVHVAELVLHLDGHGPLPVNGAELALVDRLDANHGKKVLNLLSMEMLLTRLSMTKEMTLNSFTARTT